MEEPNVSIAVSLKFVDEHHFEFTTAYGASPRPEEREAEPRIQIVQGSSSVIAPGLFVPAA